LATRSLGEWIISVSFGAPLCLESGFVTESPKQKSSTLCVRVNGDLAECIKAWAQRKHISQSDAVRMVLSERLMEREGERAIA
jgi:hypothetical protein